MQKKPFRIFHNLKTPISFILLILLASCEKKLVQFGGDFVDDDLTNVILVDTITAQVSTVFIDSVVTSGTGGILAGRYSDPYFGTVSSRSFLKIAPPPSQALDVTAAYDSMVLILKRSNNLYYGDTTATQRLDIYQMGLELVMPPYQSAFYNTSDFPLQGTPLGSTSFIYRPNSPVDTFSVRLSDSKGQELFDRYKNKDITLVDPTRFDDYFKGLCIAPGGNDAGALMNFSDSVIMRIYYHQNELNGEKKHIDFSVTETNLQFNHVEAARIPGSPLEKLTVAHNELNADSTNDIAYWQPMLGVLTRISFPYIKNVRLYPDYLKVIEATLIIKPVKSSFDENLYPLPSGFQIISSDGSSDILHSLGSAVNTREGSAQNGDLVKDYLYGNTSYTFDITAYLQSVLAVSSSEEIKPALVMMPLQSYNILNRMVIGNKENANAAIQVKLNYISLKQ